MSERSGARQHGADEDRRVVGDDLVGVLGLHAHEAERLAARSEAESRRHGEGYGGYSGR